MMGHTKHTTKAVFSAVSGIDHWIHTTEKGPYHSLIWTWRWPGGTLQIKYGHHTVVVLHASSTHWSVVVLLLNAAFFLSGRPLMRIHWMVVGAQEQMNVEHVFVYLPYIIYKHTYCSEWYITEHQNLGNADQACHLFLAKTVQWNEWWLMSKIKTVSAFAETKSVKGT